MVWFCVQYFPVRINPCVVISVDEEAGTLRYFGGNGEERTEEIDSPFWGWRATYEEAHATALAKIDERRAHFQKKLDDLDNERQRFLGDNDAEN